MSLPKTIRIVFGKDMLHIPVSNFDDLRWLKGFFYLGAGVFVLWIMAIVFNTTGMVKKPYGYYPLRLGSTIMIYWAGPQSWALTSYALRNESKDAPSSPLLLYLNDL